MRRHPNIRASKHNKLATQKGLDLLDLPTLEELLNNDQNLINHENPVLVKQGKTIPTDPLLDTLALNKGHDPLEAGRILGVQGA